MARVTRLTARVDGDPVSIRILAPEMWAARGSEHASGPRPAGEARGTVFLPPLIGGSGMHQVAYFRDLGRAGFRLATFDYRGHGKSGGMFSVRNAIADSRAVLSELTRAGFGPPFFGIGACFGAIPLLVCADERPHDFRAITLVNPVPSIQYAVPLPQLLRNYYTEGGRFRLRNPFDLKGILAATNSTLFPEIDKSREHFGILRYDRVLGRTSVWEFLTLDALRGVRCEVPTLVAFGRSDVLLGLERPAREADYRQRLGALLTRPEFTAIEEADHHFNETLPTVNRLAAEFFGRFAAAEPTVRPMATPDAGELEPTPRAIATPATRPVGTTSSVA